MTQHKPFSYFLKKYKHEHKCCICGEEADCCLEFHHIKKKEKLFSLRSVNESKYSKQVVQNELQFYVLDKYDGTLQSIVNAAKTQNDYIREQVEKYETCF